MAQTVDGKKEEDKTGRVVAGDEMEKMENKTLRVRVNSV